MKVVEKHEKTEAGERKMTLMKKKMKIQREMKVKMKM